MVTDTGIANKTRTHMEKLVRINLKVFLSFPFSFQFFTFFAAVFAEEVNEFGVVVLYGPI